VTVIGTGGTIASTTTEDRTFALPELKPEEILSSLGSLRGKVDVATVDLFHEGSSALTRQHVLQLALRIHNEFDNGSEAVIVTQGTATLPDTSYLLDLLLGDCPPVVCTGAMRNASDLSPDGPVNLRDALIFTADAVSRRRGVYVIMNGEVHAPIDVLKFFGASPAGFVSPGVGVLGWVDAEQVRMRRERRPRPRPYAGLAERVELIVTYFDAGTLLIRTIAETQEVTGLVVGGFPGRGAVPPSWVEPIGKYLDSGRPLLFTVMSLTGRALPKHGPVGATRQLHEMGAIIGGDLAPTKARCLLMAILSETSDRAEIAKLIDWELEWQ